MSARSDPLRPRIYEWEKYNAADYDFYYDNDPTYLPAWKVRTSSPIRWQPGPSHKKRNIFIGTVLMITFYICYNV